MIELAWDLFPVLMGVVASPLAIMALIAVLLSRSASRNGLCYLLGWSCSVVISLFGAYRLLENFHPDVNAEPPGWVPVVRLIIGILMGVGAVWTLRRSQAKIVAMAKASSPEEIVEAAPQLPGWLNSVESFTGPRSYLLGLGIFLLNPVNLSCAFIAALDIRLAALDSPAPTYFLFTFMLLSIIPLAIPVFLVIIKKERAAGALSTIRSWIAKHNGTLSAVFLGVVSFMQIQKALAALPWV